MLLSSDALKSKIGDFAEGVPPVWWPKHIDESAWLEHTPFAAWLIENLNPRIVVKLGTHRGVSYFAFCQAASVQHPPPRCFAIHTWIGDEHAGLYDEAVFEKVSGINATSYGAFSCLIRSTFSEALGSFDDGSIDLLHIDGLHTYEAVSQNFTTWLPKMSDRGIILFHDIVVRKLGFGVWKLWNEVTRKFPHFSFLHGYGLGVLAVGDNMPESINTLVSLEEGSVEQKYVRELSFPWGARFEGLRR